MKLTIIAVGSRGDVQPCVALGRGLLEAGYAVRIVTLEDFEPMVRGQGLEFFGIAGDAQALTNEMMLGQMKGNGLRLLSMYRGIMKTFGAITESYGRSFSSDALRDSDAILSQLPGGFYGYDLAEHLGVPYIALSVIPQEITGAWPLSLLPSQMSLGPWYNRLTYYLGQQLAWQPFRKPINAFRRGLGLPPASFWWGNMRRMRRERVPVVQGFSTHVIPTQPEWGAHVHTTGYWTLDEPEWQPSAELLAFLASGDAPVFIGFGSMPVPDPSQTTALILDALRQSGRRGLLHAGWAKLGAASLPDTVFPLDYAPYAWLFPRMAAVIHHGGSGTTGLALRSGVPSMVVPFTADQPFWGGRTHVLGVGPAPVPFSRLTADKLADAIRVMVTDTVMQRNAAVLRAAMADENGVGVAVQMIDTLLKQKSG
ncbi:MAG: glycosyltransferase [Pleurocapsa minor GSE-CHR-MK-17-07R]|jgi:UDP:flavonoid glycosyltransferase YjiC (YdhE family)|nr:glycosyltransferase [Pleurocapsa minor GSE-CHR-MK 17-07R]